MVQVLKEEVRDRIYEAALNEFYKKDFKSANMRDIADEANVSVGLLYSYFKNKEALFNEVVSPVSKIFLNNIHKNKVGSDPYLNFLNFEREILLELLKNHKEFVILVDKSDGTSFFNFKEDLIDNLTEHIKKNRLKLPFDNNLEFDEVFIHILASTFIEGLIEIARHYKGQIWAENMLDLFADYYYKGFK